MKQFVGPWYNNGGLPISDGILMTPKLRYFNEGHRST